MSCYRYRYCAYPKQSLFAANVINASYVLIMENSDQEYDMQEQLDFHKPTSTVVIQYNKGFKSCDKTKLIKPKISFDLAHSYFKAFEHALSKRFDRVLIFEEDFFLENYTKHDIQNISTFLADKKPDVYSLGTVQLRDAKWTQEGPHIKALEHMFCSHAVIYSRTYMQQYILAYENNPELFIKVDGHVDHIWGYLTNTRYMYFKPIAFQLVRLTENMKEWTTWSYNIFRNIFRLDVTNKHWCDAMISSKVLKFAIRPDVLSIHLLLWVFLIVSLVMFIKKNISIPMFITLCVLYAAFIFVTFTNVRREMMAPFSCTFDPLMEQYELGKNMLMHSFIFYVDKQLGYSLQTYEDGIKLPDNTDKQEDIKMLLRDYKKHRFRVQRNDLKSIKIYKLGLPGILTIYA